MRSTRISTGSCWGFAPEGRAPLQGAQFLHCLYTVRTLDKVPVVPSPSPARADRIELRASREEKRILSAAAAYQRPDLTIFVLRTALPVAQESGWDAMKLPVFPLGRLAVAVAVQGRGLGGELLLAVGQRALTVAEEVGGVALAIDAKDELAAQWYERFGALRLLDDPVTLVLPLATIASVLKGKRSI